MSGPASRKSHRATVSPQRIERLLHAVTSATRGGDLRNALRLADAACRCAPGNVEVASLKVALLSRLGRHAEALGLLTDPTPPALLGTRLRLLVGAGLHDDARALASKLLCECATDTVDGLAGALDDACRDGVMTGWRGFDSALRPVGNRRDLDDACGPLTPEALDFRAEGWVLRENDRLIGEVGFAWAPRLPIRLVLRTDDGSIEHHEILASVADDSALGAFSLPLPATPDDRACHVHIVCPDGRELALAGSPARVITSRPLPSRPAPRQDGRIDVIIPVHGDRSATRACIESVLATVDPADADILVINDASPDDGLVADLGGFARRAAHVTVLTNAVNLGFSASVNRGLEQHPWRDAVLLNADCVVHGDWLARLRAAAASAADIGSVTPLGHGSITSYPRAGLPADPAGPDARTVDRWAAERLAGVTVELPVAVGFCMLLRRAMLDAVGLFDAERFMRGYGEEDELCRRAAAAGWRHVAAASVFVEHRGGGSFGRARHAWMRRNRRQLLALHPHHEQDVATFLARDPLHPARRALDLARLEQQLAAAPGERVLHASLGLGGGVLRHITDVTQELLASGGIALQLRPDPDFDPATDAAAAGTEARLYLSCQPLRLHDLRFDWPAEAPALLAVLRAARFGRIELHHFLGWPETLIEALFTLDAPVNITLHDHAWICPRLTLADSQGRYCGEPAVDACATCIATHGSELPAGLTVTDLRRRSARWLAAAAHVVAPSHDTRERYRRHFPGLAIEVRPWETIDGPAPVRPPRRHDGDLRIAIPGAISAQKGHARLLACARETARLALPLQFIVIGYTVDDAALVATGRVFVTGPYEEQELGALLEREDCDLAWFPSSAPETWCYALSHPLRLGLPVLGPALGAIGERLAGHPAARLVAPDAPISHLLAELMRLGGRTPPDDLAAPVMPTASPRPFHTDVTHDTTRAATDASPPPENSPDAASGNWVHPASVQTLPLPPGIYAFTVPGGSAGRSLDAAALLGEQQLHLPAMSIGPAPTARALQVELYPAPGTLDRWLSRPGDQIVARVHGAEVPMLLTSVRRQQDRPLSINVLRLDQPQPIVAGQSPLRQLLHLQVLGDLYFGEGQAGPVHHGLAVEAFIIDCRLGELGNIAEYRAITADGFETPWLTDGMLCGSRGRGVPLLAFAIRPRVQAARRHDFICRGYFRKAGWVEAPAAQGWCRSPLADDPLEGIEARLVGRE